MKKVKSFPAQGSNLDAFSVWKPEPVPGLFPIGDIFVASESKPGAAILARPINENDDTFRQGSTKVRYKLYRITIPNTARQESAMILPNTACKPLPAKYRGFPIPRLLSQVQP